MAASYWDSTQRRYWEFTKEQLADLRQRKQDEERSLVQVYPLPEWRHLFIFFNTHLTRLAKRMQVRQQALATAQVYLKRFYCKVEIRRTNPYLTMTTALYLACKTEECPQHIRQVVQEAKMLWPDTHCLDIPRLGECEFYMISELSSQLIVHAPYRTLNTLQLELSLTAEEFIQAWTVTGGAPGIGGTQSSLPPPPSLHMSLSSLSGQGSNNTPGGSGTPGGAGGPGTPGIGGAAGTPTTAGSAGYPGMSAGAGGSAMAMVQANARAVVSAAIQNQGTPTGSQGSAGGSNALNSGAGGGNTAGTPTEEAPPADGGRGATLQWLFRWLTDSGLDLEATIDCTQEMISFYMAGEEYSEKQTREQVNRFIKARGLDR
ncbi:rna polymerase ii holoenzyme cyclin-like subunit [Ophiostoma piceae UAMH 11346]|uniref:RNA polymerase II holoenzyme cyclin-like subunit n=1 Tax=Ophiostoma piceae (strain UAMH 11346) TaxID=1262450 RepID=S3C8W4_OPHP1|nr:rna polymerase ii holoenzyme cyclin-like subunit [Ophiostoma piceae UAMH 11346]